MSGPEFDPVRQRLVIREASALELEHGAVELALIVFWNEKEITPEQTRNLILSQVAALRSVAERLELNMLALDLNELQEEH